MGPNLTVQVALQNLCMTREFIYCATVKHLFHFFYSFYFIFSGDLVSNMDLRAVLTAHKARREKD